MRLSFRHIAPKRTYLGKQYKNYRSYKPHLETDFNKRCGYSDCHQAWFGGMSNFHIDHFKAQSKFPELETVYANLVYTCSFINIAKSDDESSLYLDPCEVDFNDHFDRDKLGNIYPKPHSAEAIYMHKKLKLYLKRYGLIWTLEGLYQKWLQIKEVLANIDIEDHTLKAELTDLKKELADEFLEYFHYLRREM